MKNELLIKTLAAGIIVLFIMITVTPSIGISNYLDDTTPPVTTISFNPPEPDGEDSWYVSDVTVTLNATDDDSGVNVTIYKIDSGASRTYIEPFNLTDDGHRVINYYSIDNAGNQEEIKSAEIYIDQTKPEIALSYEVTGGNPQDGYDFLFEAIAEDETSGIVRVEFYNFDELQETVNGSGPTYQWLYHLSPLFYGLKVWGLICNPEITDEYVKFFAIIVRIYEISHYDIIHICVNAYDNAGNMGRDCIQEPSFPLGISPGIYLFKNLTLPNNYYGYIGKFFIKATFDV